MENKPISPKTHLEEARFIFTAGKLIHDKMNAAGARYFNHPNDSKKVVELSIPQKNMIMTVRKNKTITMTDLANQLGVSPPSATTMVDRLVEKDILTREPSIEDRRKVVVRISADAVTMLDGIETNMLGFFVELVEKIGPETAAQWCRVLGQVKAALETEENMLPRTDRVNDQ